MLKKLAGFIVDKRKLLLVVAAVVCVISAVLLTQVEVNEDMTKYLADDSPMKIGLDIMNEEFPEAPTTQSVRVMFENLPEGEWATVLGRLEKMEYVSSVAYDENSRFHNNDGYTLYVLNTDYAYDSEEFAAIEAALEDGVSGYDYQWRSNELAAMPDLPIWIILAAVGILLIILFVMCGSWIEPLLFLAVIGVAVLINMGTNIVLGSVSTITFSIASILQLVLSMDYSIILINRYRQEKQKSNDNIKAMKKALRRAFPSIASSAMTTVVGLLALVFMSFKIGMDLGVVLAKGVAISMLCVVTILPGVILACDKLIVKTAKKELHIPTGGAGRLSYRLRHIVAAVFVVLFVGSYILQSMTGIVYTLKDEDPIADVFPTESQLVVVYETKDEEAVAKLASEIEKDENVVSVMGYSTMLNRPYTSDKLLTAVAGMAGDVPLDESVIKMLYYDYYTGGETGKITVGDFLKFVSENVVGNELFASYIDADKMGESLDMIGNFTDAKALTTPMNSKEISALFGMPEKDIRDLYLLYFTTNGGVDTGTMSVPVFADFVLNEVSQNETYSAFFDEETKAQLSSLSMFTKPDELTKPVTYTEIAEFLGQDEETARMLFAYYHAFENGRLNTIRLLSMMNSINVESAQDYKLSVQTVVNFLSDNKDSLGDMMDEAQAAQIATAKTMVNACIDGTEYKPGELAALTGMEKSQAQQLYLLYLSGHGDTSSWKMSVEQFISFLNSDVLTNPDYASMIDGEAASMLTSAQTVISSVIDGKEYSAAEMSEMLGGMSDMLTPEMMELAYIFKAGIDSSDPEWTMSIEQMFNHLVNDMVKDPRFDAVIDTSTRDMLSSAQTQLSDGKLQLVSPDYSRMIINNIYLDESPETTAFFDNLHATLKENLSGEYYLIGNSAMNYEMQQTFDKELIFITALTIIAIFIVVAITFRSLVVPAVLVLLVQCGVYITVAFLGLQGSTIYYLALLIVECILMGSTIDYGILFTNYYRESRRKLPKKESLEAAYAGSIHTVMTSGLIMILVTAIVGKFFENPTIGQICTTISIGSFSAVLLILVVLPGMLGSLDRFVAGKDRLKPEKKKDDIKQKR
ncbi:MAG: MMPL family transporter [Clostridia bacterium]|nr:MMPL family transporter [Clostridia bacterium]